MQFKQKPLTLFCYICGRQFGTKSLEIHLKSCREKFAQEQNKKEKKERIPLPPEPQLLRDILNGNFDKAREYNEHASQIHKYKILPPCRYCGRTFNEESLKVHQNVCPNKSNSFGRGKKESFEKEETIKKPRTLVCCVCGRQFGLSSLKIHYPQCLVKFKNDQKSKPKEERKEIPRFSSEELEKINNKEQWTLEEIQQFNLRASSHFKDKAMVYCQNCRRTFMPQPFKRHLKNCELINGKNVVSATQSSSFGKQTQTGQIKKPKVLMCHICGRQFGLMSLLIHQKTCKTKFLNNEKQKSVDIRKHLPQIPEQTLSKFDFQNVEKWSIQQIQQYNKIAGEAYRSESMYECPFCHRKFIQQSFEKHRGYCQKQFEKNAEKESSIGGQYQKYKQLSSNNKSRQKKTFSPEKNYKKEQQQSAISSKKLKQNFVIGQMPEQLEHTSKTQKEETVNEIIPATFGQQSRMLIQTGQNQLQNKLSNNQKQFDGIQINQTKQKQAMEQKDRQESDEGSILNDVLQISSFSDKEICSPRKNKGNGYDMQNNLQKKDQIVLSQKQIKQNKKQKSVTKEVIERRAPENNTKNTNNNFVEEVKQKNQELIFECEQQDLAQCLKCGRKFVVQRLQRHQQVCKGTKKEFSISRSNFNKAVAKQDQHQTMPFQNNNKPKGKIQEQTEKKYPYIEDERAPENHSKMLVPCKKCGRRFLQNRVEKHQQHCKGKSKIINKDNPQQYRQQIQQMKIKTKIAEKSHPKEKDRKSLKEEKQNGIQQKPIQIGSNQYEQISELDLKPCSKCGRKFKIDRVDIHENACKGPSAKKINFQKQLRLTEKAKNLEAVRKTKENFFQMAKDIRNKKISEEQIDRDLSAQLQTFEKQPPNGKAVHRRRYELISKQRQDGRSKANIIVQNNPNMAKFQTFEGGFETISKWKKGVRTPKVSVGKLGKVVSHLPQL